jgi:periplasmic protein TonB
MFERSLVISQRSHASAAQRWTALASITLQAGLAGVLIGLPLLNPEATPFRDSAPKPLVPLVKLPKLKPVTVERSASNVVSTPPAIGVPSHPLPAPPTIRHGVPEDDPAPVQSFTGMRDTGGVPEVLATVATGPTRAVTVVPAHPSSTRLTVSSGVSAGMLMAPIRPIYPAIAIAAHVEGKVVVEAVISKGGAIESLHVVSGPEMLRASAMDAIRAARYQPYKLNGEATEVQTTITVHFRIGS